MTKKDSIKSLRILIHSLSKREVLLVSKQLVVFSGSRTNISLKLFNIIKNDKAGKLNSKDIIKKIYKNKKNGEKALRMLKERLKLKIFDFLLLDNNVESLKEIDGVERASILLRKKMSVFYLLINTKAQTDIATSLLEDIIADAKKYEAFHVLIDALQYKKFQLAYRLGEKHFDRISNEINEYEFASKAYRRANDIFYKMFLLQHYSSNPERQKYIQFLESSIIELEDLFEKTKASSVEYYLLILRRNYFQNTNQFEEAISICWQIIGSLKQNAAVYRKQRVGSAYLFLCQCLVINRKFDEALHLLSETQKWYARGSENFNLTLDINFLVLFYQNKIDEGRQLLSTLLSQFNDIQNVIRSGKIRYFHSNLLFKNREFKECLVELKSRVDLTKDRTGWDFGVRILTIKVELELEHYDQATLLIDALYKMVKSNLNSFKLRNRDIAIQKILTTLTNQSYDFKKTYALEAASFERLCSEDPEYGFEFFTHELIPFHEWFMEKAGVSS